ncbi:MAG: squalene synthase HpnC [Elusimicrobia bacterium]|nr:squalene synthase HpnC [Elusimicrobiota bacterium]MDE2236978.1 squalene synthase HpnC [Elusimicrobiota bacterium]MDE2426470.1 squalene synthase HpnC [Elusimicrobiota bacterium]
MANRHYENFPVASRLLPRRLRRHVAALYAFARIADDFADEADYEGVRRERLLDWRAQLQALERPRHPVFLALKNTVCELELPLQPFDDLLSAFLQDTEKARYATFEEVRDYCRRSADPVGRLVLLIHGYRDEELFELSDVICTGLQLANFWQDVSLDLRKDRIYIPQEDFQRFGYAEADLRMGVVNDKFVGLMKFQVGRTRMFFERGRPLANRLAFPLSWEIRLTWLGGREVLRKIKRQGYDTVSRRPRLSRLDWVPLLVRSLLKS